MTTNGRISKLFCRWSERQITEKRHRRTKTTNEEVKKVSRSRSCLFFGIHVYLSFFRLSLLQSISFIKLIFYIRCTLPSQSVKPPFAHSIVFIGVFCWMRHFYFLFFYLAVSWIFNHFCLAYSELMLRRL